MNEPTIALEALTALDIVVLEAKDDGLFVVGRPPAWFHQVFADVDLGGASPYMDNFLLDAWSGPLRLYSGVWTQRDRNGGECSLEAWAVQLAGRRLLLIHRLGEEFEMRQAALQQAREARLSYERLGKVTRGLADDKLRLEMRNREVERINQLKNEFLASMSHELRTPLNAIIGFSSLLAEESAGPLNGEQRSYVAHVARASRHLLDLINDILDLSKIEAGRMEISPEVFPLAEALEEVLATIRPLARDKNIKVVRGDSSGRQVWADRIRFKQILYNLLSNAIKFTPSKGEVRIDAAMKDNQLTVAVTDTGIGIPREEQEAIFEKFHQVGNGPKGIREGTGLGLAITKRLVEQHGGEIRVYSEPGLGSRFVFTLPYSAGSPAQPAPELPESAPPPKFTAPERRMRIAIVEDNPASRALFEAMLKPSYEVACYETGAAALAGFGRERPDLVLLDIALPDMNGLDLLRLIRAEPSTRLSPVVAVSAHAMSGDRERFLTAGFNQYLSKPIADRATLLRAIEPLLRAVEDASGRGRAAS